VTRVTCEQFCHHESRRRANSVRDKIQKHPFISYRKIIILTIQGRVTCVTCEQFCHHESRRRANSVRDKIQNNPFISYRKIIILTIQGRVTHVTCEQFCHQAQILSTEQDMIYARKARDAHAQDYLLNDEFALPILQTFALCTRPLNGTLSLTARMLCSSRAGCLLYQ